MKSHRLVSLAIPLALALAPNGLLAQEPTPRPEAVETATEASPDAAAEPLQTTPPVPLGVTVFVDPETGQLTDQPTAEQADWLRAEIQRRGKTSSNPDGFQPRPVPLLGGGEGLALQDFVVSSTYMVIEPSGAWKASCNRDGLPHSHDHGPQEGADPAAGSDASPSDDAAPVM